MEITKLNVSSVSEHDEKQGCLPVSQGIQFQLVIGS